MDVTSDNSEHSDCENEMNRINTKKSRPINRIIDSDSEDDHAETGKNDSPKPLSAQNQEDLDNISQKEPINTNSGSSISQEDNGGVSDTSEHSENSARVAINHDSNQGHESDTFGYGTARKRLLNLIDSESSEDEREDAVEHIGDNHQEKTINTEKDDFDDAVVKPVVYKPMRKKKGDKPKAMTGREAAQQKIEIQADSQKRVRESNVSLPYHVPKSYSIKEFLQKRSKFASNLAPMCKVSPSAAIKMSKHQLEEISKKMDDRIKEVEEFYKSDSNEEEEEEEEETDTADNKDLIDEISGWIFSSFETALNRIETPTEIALENDSLAESEIMPCESIVAQPEEDEPSLQNNEDQEVEMQEIDVNKTRITDLLQDEIKNLQPKLSGSPDDVIDLETGVTTPSNVKQLVEKYLQHTAKTKLHKYKVELDIVGLGRTGEIVKETVSMNIDEEEEPAVFETPGAKLQKLREELQEQMAQKRLETWRQKHEKGDVPLVENESEVIEPDEKDILDDEEEEDFEMTESEDSDLDDDGETELQEKQKNNLPFLDEEAEVDDDIEETDENDADEVDDDEHHDIDDQEEGFNSEGESESEINPPSPVSPPKKVLKRIVNAFSDDSDDDDDNVGNHLQIFKRRTDVNDEDDFLPPNLPRVNVTPQRPEAEHQKPEFDFLTPVSYLTGLQNLNTESAKFKTPESPFSNLSQPSPLKDFTQSRPSEKVIESTVPKNLFGEPSETSQNLTDLAEICSGQFSETQTNQDEDVSATQDLLNMCSGSFSNTQSSGFSSQAKKVVTLEPNPQDEIKSFETDDPIMSQLLDEAELERFKKKFESPVNSRSKSMFMGFDEVQEANATGLIDSDDENDGLELKKKNKKQKKLVFSDDEGDEDDENENEEDDDDELDDQENVEEIDLHDNIVDEDDEEQQLERQIQAEESRNYKLADFVENEAELSESEWGSADEDEKDLDAWEEEQGDKEVFNEKKIRTELERIHMRQVLDEDNREVKILQEMLLDDGELHGSGRQRQFRWRTLGEDNGEFEKRPDDDIFMDDEDESEEQFRKMRHKREMFLKKKNGAETNVDNILEDSQIFKVGKTVIRSQSSFISQNSTPTEKLPATKEPFKLLSKRGSFLSRDGEVLQRLAEYTKVNSNINSAKCNSRSFVFQTVELGSSDTKGNNKRKANEGTPASIKKIRLDTLSPAANQKKGKSQRAKQLFGGGNW